MADTPERHAEKSSESPLLKLRLIENVPKGILCMVMATVAFAIMHALSKWLVAIYPIGQVMFARSITGFLICATLILPVAGFSVFATQRHREHILRGLSQAFSQTFAVVALIFMPLAGAIAIAFSAPLWASLLSVIWLKERAGSARWFALVCGFAGILIVSNPGADLFTLGAAFALLNAIIVGTVTVAVRGMTATESPNTLLIWQLFVISIAHSFLLAFGVRWPTPVDLALLVLCGVANLIAQYYWTKALVLAPTTAVSPFFYFMLVWATAIDFIVWNEVPSLTLLIGSSIVVSSGLFLLWYEAQRRRPARPLS